LGIELLESTRHSTRIEKYVPVARQKKTDAPFHDRGKLGPFAKRAKNEPVENPPQSVHNLSIGLLE